MRRLIAIIVGLVVAVIAIDLAWGAATRWFPSAVNLDSDADTLANYVARMPIGGKLFIISGWFVSGLAGTFAALRISQWRPTAGIIGGLIIVLCTWNISQVPEPRWMQITSIIALLLGCVLAERHFHRARPGDPLIN